MGTDYVYDDNGNNNNIDWNVAANSSSEALIRSFWNSNGK